MIGHSRRKGECENEKSGKRHERYWREGGCRNRGRKGWKGRVQRLDDHDVQIAAHMLSTRGEAHFDGIVRLGHV